MTQKSLIGFIGLGRMGHGMASNLRKADIPLVVFDHDAAATERLSALGADVASSPESMAAMADLIFLCLPYSPQVKSVLFDAQGVAHAKRACTIIDTTTQNYSTTLQIAKQAQEHDLHIQRLSNFGHAVSS